MNIKKLSVLAERQMKDGKNMGTIWDELNKLF
jgi:hypothetical protein